ncbi:MAG: type II toxin-antitoxin system VapC family toxin [Thermofilum sp.]
MIVIDASALVKLLLREEGWEEVAEHVRAGAVSVDLVAKEAVNAVWRALRRGLVTREAADSMLEALRVLLGRAVKLENEMAYLEPAIGIAFTRGVTVYDALYIALAKARGLSLLTADREQAGVAEAEGVSTLLLE